MSRFWKGVEAAKPHIASAADDIRHKVVEEGWYGKQVTGDIEEWQPPQKPLTQADLDAVHTGDPAPSHRHASLYEEIWGGEPSNRELYGPEPTHLPPSEDIKRLKGPEQDDGLTPD